jgi:hypothetical protein
MLTPENTTVNTLDGLLNQQLVQGDSDIYLVDRKILFNSKFCDVGLL